MKVFYLKFRGYLLILIIISLQFWCYQFKDLRLSSSIDNNINNFNKINDLV